MISLSHLNKLILFTFFINILIFNFTISFAAVDIWEKKENDQSNTINNDKEIGEIIKVVQTGYLIQDRLLRPASVVVAKKEENKKK